MVVIMVVVMAIHQSTSMSIIVTRSTITIKTQEIPLTVLVTMSIKGISLPLGKVELAHQQHKLAADQELRPLTGHQQSLQHHSRGEPKAELQRLIELQHLTDPLRLHLIGHQHHKQKDHHRRVHQIGLLLQLDHRHHRALLV